MRLIANIKQANIHIKSGFEATNEAIKVLREELLALNRGSLAMPSSSGSHSASSPSPIPYDTVGGSPTSPSFSESADHDNTYNNSQLKPGLLPAVGATPTPKPTHSITMANGFILTFTEDEVPKPPMTMFAQNIDLLNAMWDDTSKYWDGHSYLVIKNRPIPIMYWRSIYTSKIGGGSHLWKVNNWKAIKSKIFECRVHFEFHRYFVILALTLDF